jgi:hypothetical protein
VKEKLWRVEIEPEVARELERIRAEEPRGALAVEGFIHFVSRAPASGFAILRDDPDVRSRPLHTAVAAYVVIYEFNQEAVTCIGIRKVPYSTY